MTIWQSKRPNLERFLDSFILYTERDCVVLADVGHLFFPLGALVTLLLFFFFLSSSIDRTPFFSIKRRVRHGASGMQIKFKNLCYYVGKVEL